MTKDFEAKFLAAPMVRKTELSPGVYMGWDGRLVWIWQEYMGELQAVPLTAEGAARASKFLLYDITRPLTAEEVATLGDWHA